jgi:hypothetical protein
MPIVTETRRRGLLRPREEKKTYFRAKDAAKDPQMAWAEAQGGREPFRLAFQRQEAGLRAKIADDEAKRNQRKARRQNAGAATRRAGASAVIHVAKGAGRGWRLLTGRNERDSD